MDKITFNITEKEKKKLKQIAEGQGLFLATFCRYILLKQLKNGGSQNGN